MNPLVQLAMLDVCPQLAWLWKHVIEIASEILREHGRNSVINYLVRIDTVIQPLPSGCMSRSLWIHEKAI
jgi:hypothetical protein